MKRKVVAIIALLAMVFSMTGCSKEGVELLTKMQQVSSWEAANIKGNTKMNFELAGASMNMEADITGYVVQKPLKAEMTLTINTLEVNDGTKKIPVKLSPVKVYMDGMKMYMSSSYLKEVAAMAGADGTDELGQVFDLSKDFIAIDMTSTFKEMGISEEQLYSMNTNTYSQLGKMNTNVEVKKDGDKYSVSLDESQIVDAVISTIKELVANKEYQSMMNELLKNTGEAQISDKEIQAAIIEINTSLDKYQQQAKDVLKGSNVNLSYEFGKDSYKATLGFNLAISDQSSKASFGFSEDISVNKAEKKDINFPTSVSEYDYMELINNAIMGPVNNAVYVLKQDTINKNGITYVPVKEVAESAGYKVSYDAKTKTVYIEAAGNKIPLKTIAAKGKSYMNINDAKNIGINVEVVTY